MALKVEELRIGNLVYDDENIVVKIEHLMSDRYMDWNGGFDNSNVDFSKESDAENIYNSDFNPIPLTEEWLLKFGFTPSYVEGITAWYKDDFVVYQAEEDDKEFFGCMFNATWNKIWMAVHELQNFYYALTGQELTA